MDRRYLRLLNKQPQVKVVSHAQRDNSLNVRFVMLAAAFAGFFYFFGGNLWHALSGG